MEEDHLRGWETAGPGRVVGGGRPGSERLSGLMMGGIKSETDGG